MKQRMLPELIRKKRKEKGINQLELADTLGLSEMTIRRWENGKVSPRIEEIEKTAEVLNTSVEYLMGLTDDAPPETPQISLPISNNVGENKVGNDDLDLAYWGGVVDKANRAARSGDSQKIPLITALLQSALDAIKGAKASIEAAPKFVNIQSGNNNKNNMNVETA